MPQLRSHLTVICQDVCGTKLTLTTQSSAQEYRHQFFHLHVIRTRGTSPQTAVSEDCSSVELKTQRKSPPKCFLGSVAHQAAQKLRRFGGSFPFYLFAIFSAENRHYMDGVKQQMGQEQDTLWSCYQEEDEPQKLHNFLISSLPDTWLNSVVQWAALTSTFCMICKTDFL